MGIQAIYIPAAAVHTNKLFLTSLRFIFSLRILKIPTAQEPIAIVVFFRIMLFLSYIFATLVMEGQGE